MGFTEDQKRAAREQAGYRCCWCQIVKFVEVHHIDPLREGGPDELDNAAALCPSCHAEIGDSPMLRKQLRERRDWLYGKVREWYGGDRRNLGTVEEIASIMMVAGADPTRYPELGPALHRLLDEKLAASAGPEIADTASAVVNAVEGWRPMGRQCAHCGSLMGPFLPVSRVGLPERIQIGANALDLEGSVCPKCGREVFQWKEI